MSRGTIKVPQEVKDRHNERRKELGLTWADYMDAMMPDSPATLDEERVREIVREEFEQLVAEK